MNGLISRRFTCHPEQSKGSRYWNNEISRFARNDTIGIGIWL